MHILKFEERNHRAWRETYQLPGVEVHASQFAVVRLGDVYIQRLALIDVRAAVGGHLENGLLGDLPHGLVEGLQVVRNDVDVLMRRHILFTIINVTAHSGINEH